MEKAYEELARRLKSLELLKVLAEVLLYIAVGAMLIALVLVVFSLVSSISSVIMP